MTVPSERDLNVHIGRRLRRRRRLMGLTLQGLAKIVGVRFQQIQKYEAATNAVSAARLLALAKALKVPTDYFYEDFAGAPASAASERSDAAAAFSRLKSDDRELLLSVARRFQ